MQSITSFLVMPLVYICSIGTKYICSTLEAVTSHMPSSYHHPYQSLNTWGLETVCGTLQEWASHHHRSLTGERKSSSPSPSSLSVSALSRPMGIQLGKDNHLRAIWKQFPTSQNKKRRGHHKTSIIGVEVRSCQHMYFLGWLHFFSVVIVFEFFFWHWSFVQKWEFFERIRR